MQFDLTGPCRRCPFRSDREPFLRAERAEEIADGLLSTGTFPCHKTVDYSESDEGSITGRSQFCGGALATMKANDELMENQTLRSMARLGIFPPEEVSESAPVFGSLGAWVDAHW